MEATTDRQIEFELFNEMFITCIWFKELNTEHVNSLRKSKFVMKQLFVIKIGAFRRKLI